MDFYILKEEIVKSLNFTLGVVEKRQTLPSEDFPIFESEHTKS